MRKYKDEVEALAQGPLGTRLEDYICPAKKKCKGWKKSPCKHVSSMLGIPSLDAGRQVSVPKARGSKSGPKTRQETVALMNNEQLAAWDEMRWEEPSEFGARKGLPPPDTWFGPLNPFDSSDYFGPPLDEILDQAPNLTETEREALHLFLNESETQEAVATALDYKDHKSAVQALKRGLKKLSTPETQERIRSLFESYQDDAGEEE